MTTHPALIKITDKRNIEKPYPIQPWHKVAYDAYAALLRLKNLPRWIKKIRYLSTF